MGYMAISLMLKPGDELMTLVINSMRNDIVGNMHGGQCLGLAAVITGSSFIILLFLVNCCARSMIGVQYRRSRSG